MIGGTRIRIRKPVFPRRVDSIALISRLICHDVIEIVFRAAFAQLASAVQQDVRGYQCQGPKQHLNNMQWCTFESLRSHKSSFPRNIYRQRVAARNMKIGRQREYTEDENRQP